MNIYNDDGTVTLVFLGRGIPLLTDSNLTRGRFEFIFSGDFEEFLGVGKSAGFTTGLVHLDRLTNPSVTRRRAMRRRVTSSSGPLRAARARPDGRGPSCQTPVVLHSRTAAQPHN